MNKGLGRVHAPDERDRTYLLKDLVPLARVERKTKRWAMFHKPLDQGDTGTCVGHGWQHWMLTAPIIAKKPHTEPTALTIYREACRLDPWSENDNGDLQFGTAVRAGAKALQVRGHIGTYGWAFTIDDVIDWLCSRGPLVIGVNWYAGMFQKDKSGFIHPTGRISGGHCVELDAYNDTKGSVGGPNSWGTWGRLKMTCETLERLLREDGEACTAVEQRRVAA